MPDRSPLAQAGHAQEREVSQVVIEDWEVVILPVPDWDPGPPRRPWILLAVDRNSLQVRGHSVAEDRPTGPSVRDFLFDEALPTAQLNGSLPTVIRLNGSCEHARPDVSRLLSRRGIELAEEGSGMHLLDLVFGEIVEAYLRRARSHDAGDLGRLLAEWADAFNPRAKEAISSRLAGRLGGCGACPPPKSSGPQLEFFRV